MNLKITTIYSMYFDLDQYFKICWAQQMKFLHFG